MPISDPITAQIDNKVETGTSTPSTNKEGDTETTPSLGGLISTSAPLEGDELNNDGFSTPTSSPHRIPETRPCPRAPKKQRARPRSMGRKRKGSPGSVWMSGDDDDRIPILLDLTNEVEAMFPPVVRANLTSKIKKARSEVLI